MGILIGSCRDGGLFNFNTPISAPDTCSCKFNMLLCSIVRSFINSTICSWLPCSRRLLARSRRLFRISSWIDSSEKSSLVSLSTALAIPSRRFHDLRKDFSAAALSFLPPTKSISSSFVLDCRAILPTLADLCAASCEAFLIYEPSVFLESSSICSSSIFCLVFALAASAVFILFIIARARPLAVLGSSGRFFLGGSGSKGGSSSSLISCLAFIFFIISRARFLALDPGFFHGVLFFASGTKGGFSLTSTSLASFFISRSLVRSGASIFFGSPAIAASDFCLGDNIASLIRCNSAWS